jgi:hypothetical protein
MFAILAGLAVVFFAFKPVERLSRQWWSLVFYFSTVTASHGVLDAINESPSSVAFFAPFSSVRYLFPYHLLPGVGVFRFFTSFGEAVFLREICLIWIPGIAVALSIEYGRRKTSKSCKLEAHR